MASLVLTSERAAVLLGVRPGTLRNWRVTGNGPEFIRYGGPRGRVVYRLEDIQAFLCARKHQSTSEEVV